MPSRNVVKEYIPDAYYHVYNRGVEKRTIFLDEQDYTVFLGLLKKYLTGERPGGTNNRHKFENLGGQLELLAYCLMPNHFHLLFYQEDAQAISRLMRRLITGYVMYFNNRYRRVGRLFQGTYKASLINADDYLQHISRYIHLNPDKYEQWPYSSYPYYVGKKRAAWIKPGRILEIFDNNTEEYKAFTADCAAAKKELDILRHQLADDPADL